MLRKIITIICLLLLVFNWYGYKLVVKLMMHYVHQEQEVLINSTAYDESDLVEVSIPLDIPYQQDDDEFERVYGEAEVDGIFYTYVKRKVEQGVLKLKCLPNKEKEKLHEAGNRLAKQAIGFNGENNNPYPKQFLKFFWSEYEPATRLCYLAGVNDITKPATIFPGAALSKPWLDVIHQPPKPLPV